MRRVMRWGVNAVVAAAAVLVTIVFVYALQARRLSDLQPWHTQAPHLEVTAADMGPDFTLAQYLERERLQFPDPFESPFRSE